MIGLLCGAGAATLQAAEDAFEPVALTEQTMAGYLGRDSGNRRCQTCAENLR
jgi:hypothetical protein